jgi:hypothetical protein
MNKLNIINDFLHLLEFKSKKLIQNIQNLEKKREK